MDQHNDAPIALQLWTVRDSINADFDRAFAAINEVGFSAVELAALPPGISAERFADCLQRHGLSVMSIHTELPNAENIGQLSHLARACRCSKVIWHGWPRDERFNSLNGIGDLISACNEAANVTADHGLKFGLHNHWWEFETVEGELPIRLLHERLRPEIFWQLDVYWAQTGGADPAVAALSLGSRLGSLHWKDGPTTHGEPMTALGRGRVDIPRILKALDRPLDWVIELDECASDPLEAAREGRNFLEAHRNQA